MWINETYPQGEAAQFAKRTGRRALTYIDGNAYGEVLLFTRRAADLNAKWETAGMIIGRIQYNPMGNVDAEGIYFTSPERPPRGTSPGNH